MKNKAALYGQILFAVTAWGISFIATKVALEELSPVTIIILRLLLSIILLLGIGLYSKKDFSFSFKENYAIIILAAISVFHLWIQVTGLQYTSASHTGWIIGTAPVFMAILGRIVFKEKLSYVNIAGIIICSFGLFLLISNGDLTSIEFLSNKGDFMILASAFTWSVYSMVNKKITFSYSPLMTTLYLFITMAVIVIPFNLSSQAIQSVITISTEKLAAVLFLGIVCSGISYVLWARALSKMSSAKVGSFLYIEPFITVLAANLLLQEKITLLIIISGFIISAGVFLVNRK